MNMQLLLFDGIIRATRRELCSRRAHYFHEFLSSFARRYRVRDVISDKCEVFNMHIECDCVFGQDYD